MGEGVPGIHGVTDNNNSNHFNKNTNEITRSNSQIVNTGLNIAGVGLANKKPVRYTFKFKNKNANKSDLDFSRKQTIHDLNAAKLSPMNIPDPETVDRLFKELINSEKFCWNYSDTQNLIVNDQHIDPLLKFQNFSSRRKWDLIIRNLRDENLNNSSNTIDNISNNNNNMFIIDQINYFLSNDPKSNLRKLERTLYQLEKMLRQYIVCQWFIENNDNLLALERLLPFIHDNLQYVFLRCLKSLVNYDRQTMNNYFILNQHHTENDEVATNPPLLHFLIKIILHFDYESESSTIALKTIKNNLEAINIILSLVENSIALMLEIIWKSFHNQTGTWLKNLIQLISLDDPKNFRDNSKDIQRTMQFIKMKDIIYEYILSTLKLINSILEYLPSINNKYKCLKTFKENNIHQLFYLIEQNLQFNHSFDIPSFNKQMQRFKTIEENIVLQRRSDSPSMGYADLIYDKHLQLLIEKSMKTPLEDSLNEMFQNLLKIIELSTYSESINLFNAISSLSKYCIDKYKDDSIVHDNEASSKILFQDSLEKLIDNLQSDEIARRAMEQLQESQDKIDDLTNKLNLFKKDNNFSKTDIFEELKQANSMLDEKESELESLTLHCKSLEEQLKIMKKQADKIISNQRLQNDSKNNSNVSLPQNHSSLFETLGYSPEKVYKIKSSLQRKSSIKNSKRMMSLTTVLNRETVTPGFAAGSLGENAFHGSGIDLSTPTRNNRISGNIYLSEGSPPSQDIDTKSPFLLSDNIDGPTNSKHIKNSTINLLSLTNSNGISLGGVPPPPPPLPLYLNLLPTVDSNITQSPTLSGVKMVNSTSSLFSIDSTPLGKREPFSLNITHNTSLPPPPPPPPLPSNFSSISLSKSDNIIIPPPPPPLPSNLSVVSLNKAGSAKEITVNDLSVPTPPPLLMAISAASKTDDSNGMNFALNKSSIKLKQIHWDKIDDVEGTLWQDFDRRKGTVTELQHDGIFQEVDSYFKAKEIVKLVKKKTETNLGKSKKPVSFLSRDLQQQFGINLHMYSNLSVDEFVSKVFKCDSIIIKNLSVLEFFCKEELSTISPSLIKRYEPYDNPENQDKLPQLERADEIFYKLIYKTGSYWGARSHSLLITRTYEKDYYDLIFKLQKIDNAIVRLKTSENLQKFLYIIIETGNYMNTKTVTGIKISSLTKLAFIKSSVDNNYSFLHFIERMIRVKYPDIYCFVDEIKCIEELGKLTLDQLELECQEFGNKVNVMYRDITEGKLSDEDKLASGDEILQKVKFKASRAKSKNDLLQDHLKLTNNDMNQLLKYYGEDSRDNNIDSRNKFFFQIVEFLQLFKKCSRENIERESIEALNDQRKQLLAEREREKEKNTVGEEPILSSEKNVSVDTLLTKLREIDVSKGHSGGTTARDKMQLKRTQSNVSPREKRGTQLLERAQTMLNDIQKI